MQRAKYTKRRHSFHFSKKLETILTRIKKMEIPIIRLIIYLFEPLFFKTMVLS